MKFKLATVKVPLLLEDEEEPPPVDPQALEIRLSPSIEDSRARYAHKAIGGFLLDLKAGPGVAGFLFLLSGSSRSHADEVTQIGERAFRCR